jgi:hypothetical protein
VRTWTTASTDLFAANSNATGADCSWVLVLFDAFLTSAVDGGNGSWIICAFEAFSSRLSRLYAAAPTNPASSDNIIVVYLMEEALFSQKNNSSQNLAARKVKKNPNQN